MQGAKDESDVTAGCSVSIVVGALSGLVFSSIVAAIIGIVVSFILVIEIVGAKKRKEKDIEEQNIRVNHNIWCSSNGIPQKHELWVHEVAFDSKNRPQEGSLIYCILADMEYRTLYINKDMIPFDAISALAPVSATGTTAKAEGTISRALVGGAIAGDVGAIVGAMTAPTNITSSTTSYGLILYLRDVSNPQTTLYCPPEEFQRLYAFIHACLSSTGCQFSG